ncbi:MAG: mannonate dehydratase [Clostridia bacterium]|nr:mannonate dehydratase [Clostridia bacterium]
MKMTFRWYGDSDRVSLDEISQIPGVSGIVSAVYGSKPGELWRESDILHIKNSANAHGLEFKVVESVPVHEEIKLWGADARELSEIYAQNVIRLGKAGIDCICYNFMPVFDWFRTDLRHVLPDGSNCLAYDDKVLSELDPTGDFHLPGWDESYTKDELKRLLERYAAQDAEKLWDNYERFLRIVIPAAESCGVKMAVHPDDPPWGIFGLPRIITGEDSVERLMRTVDSPSNGLTFCTGSLGADPSNDPVKIARKYASRIPFAHLRNVEITGERRFIETAHPTACGSLDMYGIVKALVEGGFDGYVRPDHGRMIWGETGKGGYGLYDRALGAAYLNGLFEGVTKCAANGTQDR